MKQVIAGLIAIFILNVAKVNGQLSDLALKKDQRTYSLTWTASSEVNTRGFEIQRRRMDASTNEIVGFVSSETPGSNNSANIHYHFADPAFLDDISYYQVKQTNLDGKVIYSDPVFVDKLVNRASLFIYPNPSSGNNIKVAFAWEGKKEIQLNDLSGRRIQQWSAFSGPRLEISGLLPGSYVLTVMDNESRDRDSKLMIVSR